MNSTRDLRIRFVGAGNMAASLIGGLLNKGLTASQISASDPGEEQRDYIRDKFRIMVHADNNAHFGMPDIVVLAVKPQVMKTVLADVKDSILTNDPLVISVAAGITTAQIERWLTPTLSVVRTMPNTPALIGQGAIGMFANGQVDQRQKRMTEQIMDAVGTAVWLDEETQVDAVTALSGSGPAYFFMFMEHLQAAAESLGLSARDAALLTKKTAVGAALLAERSDESLATLRERVTSPNGTTAAALEAFAQQHIDAIISQALQAANERSVTLSREFD